MPGGLHQDAWLFGVNTEPRTLRVEVAVTFDDQTPDVVHRATFVVPHRGRWSLPISTLRAGAVQANAAAVIDCDGACTAEVDRWFAPIKPHVAPDGRTVAMRCVEAP